jgi:hypothetical protein
MTEEIAVLLTLLRAGLYGVSVTVERSLSAKQWETVFDIAMKQGVSTVAGEGLSFVNQQALPPKVLLLQWIGQSLAQKQTFSQQRNEVESLCKLWRDAGVDCIELKGNSIGRYYYVPESRYSCDFDCFLSDYEKGNQIVEAAGVNLNRSFYKNSSFTWKGLYVENHQFCTPVRGNKAMKRLERKLRELLEGCQEYPSADFSALFLMEHAWAHFFEEALTLKQLCDWAVFRKACGDDVDWSLYEREAKACGFWHFSESMNRLADLLEGTRKEEKLEGDDLLLLHDMLHEHSIQMNNGWKTRIQLVRNYFSQSWKYRVFSNHSMLYTLCRTAWGFVFDRKPKV